MHFQYFVIAILACALTIFAAPQGYEDCECTETYVPTTSSVYPSSTWAPPPSAISSSAYSAPTAGSSSECEAGAAMCCQEVTTPGNATAAYGGLLDGILGELADGLVGLGCTSVPVLGGNCENTPVCCNTEPISGGLINIGCVPIGAGL